MPLNSNSYIIMAQLHFSLTTSMKYSASWKADSQSWKFPRFTKPEVSFSPSQELSQTTFLVMMSLIYTLLKHVPKIHFNIILLSLPRSSERPLSFRLANQNCERVSHFPCSLHAQSISSLLIYSSQYFMNNANYEAFIMHFFDLLSFHCS
jgi:hypothetical protein